MGFLILFVGVLVLGGIWIAATLRSSKTNKQELSQGSVTIKNEIGVPANEILLQAITFITDEEALLTLLTEEIAGLLEAKMMGFLIYDEAGEVLHGLKPFCGLENDLVTQWFSLASPPESHISRMWAQQSSWQWSNNTSEPTIDDLGLREPFQILRIKNSVLIPLMDGNNQIGLMLAANKKGTSFFTDEDIDTLLFLSPRCGTLINASLQIASQSSSPSMVSERQYELRRTETLLRLSTELSTSLDLDRVLHRCLSLMQEVVPADQGAILLMPIETDNLILRASFGFPEPIPPGGRPSRYSRVEGLAGWVIQNRQPIIVDDLPKDERWIPFDDDLPKQQAALTVPMITKEEVIGVIILYSKEKDAFTPEHLRFVTAAGAQIAVAISNAELYTLIRDQAEHLGSLVRGQQIETSKTRAILNSITDGVIVSDSQHNTILFNPAAERLLGRKRSDVINQPVFEILDGYGTAGAKWSEAIRAWSDLEEEPTYFHAEQITLNDGRVISVHPAPVVIGEEFLGTVSILRDISREVEVDRLKSEFVATVSHELRTPMTSIKGFVDLLLMGVTGTLSGEQHRFLEIVRSNTIRLEILVNDLLDISRIESGRILLKLEPIPLSHLFSEIEAFIHQLARDNNKSMEVELFLPEDIPEIEGDMERVRQILENLVENSVLYTPSGGIITLRAAAVEDQVEIEVSDTGMGISLQEQNRIFERFYRGEQALNLGVAGTGLGLSIVLNLVEMHGGRIWVTSEGSPGSGTSFTVAMPIAKSLEDMQPETEPS